MPTRELGAQTLQQGRWCYLPSRMVPLGFVRHKGFAIILHMHVGNMFTNFFSYSPHWLTSVRFDRGQLVLRVLHGFVERGGRVEEQDLRVTSSEGKAAATLTVQQANS